MAGKLETSAFSGALKNDDSDYDFSVLLKLSSYEELTSHITDYSKPIPFPDTGQLFMSFSKHVDSGEAVDICVFWDQKTYEAAHKMNTGFELGMKQQAIAVVKYFDNFPSDMTVLSALQAMKPQRPKDFEGRLTSFSISAVLWLVAVEWVTWTDKTLGQERLPRELRGIEYWPYYVLFFIDEFFCKDYINYFVSLEPSGFEFKPTDLDSELALLPLVFPFATNTQVPPSAVREIPHRSLFFWITSQYDVQELRQHWLDYAVKQAQAHSLVSYEQWRPVDPAPVLYPENFHVVDAQTQQVWQLQSDNQQLRSQNQQLYSQNVELGQQIVQERESHSQHSSQIQEKYLTNYWNVL